MAYDINTVYLSLNGSMAFTKRYLHFKHELVNINVDIIVNILPAT